MRCSLVLARRIWSLLVRLTSRMAGDLPRHFFLAEDIKRLDRIVAQFARRKDNAIGQWFRVEMLFKTLQAPAADRRTPAPGIRVF